MTRQEFIDKAWNEAIKAEDRGANFSTPIAVAQAALESNYGESELASVHNNLFGIKGSYKGESALYRTKEQRTDGSWYTVEAEFKSYPSWSACFQDYADIIERLPWYKDAADASNVPRDYLNGLVSIFSETGELIEPGWATDNSYFEKVWSIAEKHYLLQRSESSKSDEFDLLVVYDGDRRLILSPIKCTVGMTNEGKPKLMVRVHPTSFWERLKFLFG